MAAAPAPAPLAYATDPKLLVRIDCNFESLGARHGCDRKMLNSRRYLTFNDLKNLAKKGARHTKSDKTLAMSNLPHYENCKIPFSHYIFYGYTNSLPDFAFFNKSGCEKNQTTVS